MQWRRLGLLFPPVRVGDWAQTHAALPILDDQRLYFTARDATGRGHIGRATVSLTRRAIDSVENEPVLRPGALGAFDDSGVTGSCLVRHTTELRLFYTGWMRGVTVPFYLSAGVAVSTDGGATFERASEAPLLDRNATDPYMTASPWIMVDSGVWRMWYVSAVGWVRLADGTVQHRYHIRYAESMDGWHWQRNGVVCIDFANPDEYAFGRPCVVKDGDLYRMWYCVRGDRYRLGYAESADGVMWRRLDHQVGLDPDEHGWERGTAAYPIVADVEGHRWLLYNGDGYGRTGIGLATLDVLKGRNPHQMRSSFSSGPSRRPAPRAGVPATRGVRGGVGSGARLARRSHMLGGLRRSLARYPRTMRPDLLREHPTALARMEERLFWFRSRRTLIINALCRYFPDARHICEIGCGAGFVLEGVRQAAASARIVGGDTYIEGLAQARRRVPSVPLVQLDIVRPPFNAVFDLVCLFDVLEHIEDDRGALQGVRAITVPGAGLMLTVPQHDWLWSTVDDYSLHQRRYTSTSLETRLTEAGFRTRLLTSFNSLLLPALLYTRRRKQGPAEMFDPLAEYKVSDTLNWTLFRIMELERWLIERGMRLPAGGSLIAVAERV